MTPGSGYDAFISYSHALDGALAPVFQRELERFAKRWNQMRSLRVFRDNANLAANPGLWSSIVQALSDSRWFVLMASTDAERARICELYTQCRKRLGLERRSETRWQTITRVATQVQRTPQAV